MLLHLQTLAWIIPLLLIVEGFFSGAEIALLSADRLKLQARAHRGSRRAQMILNLIHRPERVFSVTLLVNCFCVIGTSTLLTLYFISKGHRHAEFLSICVASPLIILFGELLPKTLYRRIADRVVFFVAPTVTVVYYLFFPITRLISGYTNQLSRLLGPLEEALTGKKRTTRDELLTALSFGKKDSEIKPSEKRMIKRIFDFKDTEAKHALIPLVKVEAIEEKATLLTALERFKAHRHSRMPVFSGRIDNIVGVLDVSDLFGMHGQEQTVSLLMTPAHYVAETQSLEDVLFEMQRHEEEMVLVVDEYGGAIGILTLEDIVEEVVGEIQDEYDSEAAPYKEITNNTWVIQARMEIAQINESIRLELPEGDYETLGGFLLQQFGRIPSSRDELYFDTPRGPLKFTIQKANERQIESVQVEVLE